MEALRTAGSGRFDLNTHDAPAGDGNVNGFGLEFFIETPGSEIAETIHDVKKSWQFQLLYTVSQLAAGARPSHGTLKTPSGNCSGPGSWDSSGAHHPVRKRP